MEQKPTYEKLEQRVNELEAEANHRRKAEKSLLQAQKFEAISILSGGVAHDFNNLLSIIMGYIELAKDEITPEGEGFEFLTEAEKASLLAQELTKQLTTFSRGGEPVRKIGSIGQFVKNTTSLSIFRSNIEYEFSIPHDLWLVEFDEGQMTYAVNNIIVNAVESMPDGGKIDVKAENVVISSENGWPFPEGKYVKIYIRDQGVGIAEKNQSQIFVPYFSTKERGTQKGMGLGLITTYSIINRHDGYITVESKVGAGTTFILFLPASEKDAAKLEPTEISEKEIPEVRTGRILLMDDEEMIRNLGREVLSRLGYNVELAKDGDEAVELYQKAMDSGKPFEMIILDLTVKEGLGGKDAVMKILEINPQTKAIVSSGNSNDPVMSDFKEYGFIGALPKPYTKKGLIDMLNRL